MKILFYHACSCYDAPFCELIDEAERLSREGNEVFFATCHGVMNSCHLNLLGNNKYCKLCQSSARRTLSLLNKSIRRIEMDRYVHKKEFDWDFTNGREIKQITYKGLPIGYAVMSTYITKTRDINPTIDGESKAFFCHLLSQAAYLSDAIESLVSEIKPDRICVFNGRFFESSPVVQYALCRHISVYVYELISCVGKQSYKVVYKNHLAHDILYINGMMESAWNNSKKTLEERISIGQSFFEKRRNGIKAGDRVYTAHQQKGLLPTNWDGLRCNVVIFNSSEDEFAAIGDEFERYSLFADQLSGIKEILHMFEGDDRYHFYVRVHPNLMNVTYDYHTDLYKLGSEYHNVTVIHASDRISSYALLDSADKVVVFGSSMGIESSYWGKPVILLAGALYYHLNICYIPHTVEELYTMLSNPYLSPKDIDKIPFYKYGFFFLDAERAYRPNSFDIFDYNPTVLKIGKKTIHATNCQKMLGSTMVYALYMTVRRLLAKLFGNNSSCLRVLVREG